MSNKGIAVYADALKRKEKEDETKPKQKSTRELTWERDPSRDISLDKSREKERPFSREIARDLPTRDEIQEFSFRLRDTLKVKVQAEVPHEWQNELDEIARHLNVKKLELYRFIYGEFLGKIQEEDHPERGYAESRSHRKKES